MGPLNDIMQLSSCFLLYRSHYESKMEALTFVLSTFSWIVPFCSFVQFVSNFSGRGEADILGTTVLCIDDGDSLYY